MANPEHLKKLDEGIKAWNEMLKAMPGMVADLRGADLSGKDLSGADLRGAQLEGAKLRGTKVGRGTQLWFANITKADLFQADFSGTELDDVNFTGSDLFQANFREAHLRGADLSNTDGFLRTEQFAGADLNSTKLPERLKRLYESLENVKGISESARKIFLAVLAGCLYCWLTIATTTDVNLITNRASSSLPIIQTPIPIVGFYVVAPLLILCVYFYFHFYLQKLWEELGSLPAIFPDGRPLHTKVDPWLLNDLVRAHLPKLNVDRPFLSYLQLWISVLLAWWIVPVTMFLFWGRYLRRHEWIGTTFHVLLLVISSVAAVCLYRLAVATLCGDERKPFTWKGTLTSQRGYPTAAFAVAAGVLFGLASWGAIWGVRSAKPIIGIQMPLSEFWCDAGAGGLWTWVPRLMALIDTPPFANLTGAEVSQKKPNWNPKNDQDQSSVVAAHLRGANLRYSSAEGAFFAGADLSGAQLTGAYLYGVDLTGADLTCADTSTTRPCVPADLTQAVLINAVLSGADFDSAKLISADLTGAHLNGAVLSDADLTGAKLKEVDLTDTALDGADLNSADLSGAKLTRADLTHSDLRHAMNLDPDAVRSAQHSDRAFYDCSMIGQLGLPLDNNVKLFEELHKDKTHQPKEDEKPPEPCPSPKQ